MRLDTGEVKGVRAKLGLTVRDGLCRRQCHETKLGLRSDLFEKIANSQTQPYDLPLLGSISPPIRSCDAEGRVQEFV